MNVKTLGLFLVALLIGATTFFFLSPSKKNNFDQKNTAYSNSQKCFECHKQEFDEWKNSHHGLAERMISPKLDHEALKKLQKDNQGKLDTPERVIGHDPLRQFLVKFPGGRYQTLDTAYDPKRKEWFNVFGKEDRRPGEWGHWTGRGMNWNSNCASCHNTNVQKNYDEKTDSYNTTISEMAVSCESCHGPLKEHGEIKKAPKKFNKEQIIETCATCHSRRQELTGEFKPGDSFYDHYSLSIVDGSDIFYSDGQVKGENYEYSSFLGSKMYEKGVRCIDCHNPHTAKVRLPGNLMCMKCHDGGDSKIPAIDPKKHSFHQIDSLYLKNDLKKLEERDKRKVAKMGGECINCHMPQTLYMERHWRHDHGFTIPDPKLTKDHQIPNACNRCHQDKNADWAIKWTQKWYGKKMDRSTRERAEIISKVKIGDQSSILKLMEMAKEEKSHYWKAVAINLLGPFSQDISIKNLLINFLDDSHPLVREKAAQFFEGDIPKKILKDPSRSVRFNAQWALRSNLDLQSPEGLEMEKILNFRSDQPVGRLQKGAFFLARGNSSEALLNYKKASEWDPFSAPIHHDMAIILAGQNRLDEAVIHLKRACELEPKDAEHRYKLALAQNELGNKMDAIKSLKIAVKLDQNHARAWYSLGLSLNSIGKKKEAKEALRRAQSLN